jgi:hypothetical protein
LRVVWILRPTSVVSTAPTTRLVVCVALPPPLRNAARSVAEVNTPARWFQALAVTVPVAVAALVAAPSPERASTVPVAVMNRPQPLNVPLAPTPIVTAP